MKPELGGESTGLGGNLINNFKVLLRTLSSGYDINFIKFEKLYSEAKTVYLNLYFCLNLYACYSVKNSCI